MAKPAAPKSARTPKPATPNNTPKPPATPSFDGLHAAVMHAKITTAEVFVHVEGHATPLHGKVAAVLNGAAVVEGASHSYVVPLYRITSIGFRTLGMALQAASDPT